MTDEDRAGLPEPLRENLVRAMPGLELRGESADGRLGTLYGRLANYGQWAEVRSTTEPPYHFMERIQPGAFTKTFAENRSRMQVIFDHGQDRNIGRKPLGALEGIDDRADGIDYTASLIDAPYNREIVPGLRAGLYGNSWRMSIARGKDDWNFRPGKSDRNPEGIPEHTVREAKVIELGPTPFPVYEGTPAGMRSMTDEYVTRVLTADPDRLAELIRALPAEPPAEPAEPASALPGAEEPHSDEGSRSEPPPADPPPVAAPSPNTDPTERVGSLDSQESPVSDDIRADAAALSPTERPARLAELRARAETFTDEHTGALSKELEAEWNGLTSEIRSLEADIKAYELRKAFVADRAVLAENTESTDPTPIRDRAPSIQSGNGRVQDIYSLGEIRSRSNGIYDEKRLLRESAMRAIEDGRFSHMDKAVGQGAVEKTLKTAGSVEDDRDDYVARRILLTGNPVYRRALHKTLVGQMLNVEELTAYSRFQEYERAMGQVTGSAGGFGVTFDLDPTMIQTSNGAVVPYRRAARVVTITTNEWRGVTSGGVTASYAAEAAVGTDNSPTLAQPAAIVQKAHCFVPFSMEIQGDYAGLESELGREIQDAKDVLEAVQFTTGAGTTVFPQGIVTGSTTGFNTATTLVLAAADLYGTEFTLAPRFRTNARWFANRAFYNRIRAIDTAGGAQLWTQNLTVGIDNNREGNTGYRLLGYPAEECSGFSTSIATTTKMAVFGDASYFVIVDRVGLNLELVPILTQQATAGTGFGIPTGQRGVYAWWRNTSKVLSASAFLTVTGL